MPHLASDFVVESPSVRYDDEFITASYTCAPAAAASPPLSCCAGLWRRCNARGRAWDVGARPPKPPLASSALLSHAAARRYSSTRVTRRGGAQNGGGARSGSAANGGGAAHVAAAPPEWVVEPTTTRYEFRTKRTVPKLGHANPSFFSAASLVRLTLYVSRLRSVMLVGWGGNNGTTVTAGIIANRERVALDFPVSLFLC